jgi:hypothetical protein
MANISLPNTISNGQEADAVPVMANFNAIVNDYNGNIDNTNVASAAAIAYSKLNLTTSILNSDINASAAIVYSKLNLAGGIVNADVKSTAAIVESKLAFDNSTGHKHSGTTGTKVLATDLDMTGLTSGYFLYNNAGTLDNAASTVTQVNDVETSGVATDNNEATLLSVAKTITSGKTVFLVASGYVKGDAKQVTLYLKQGVTTVQTLIFLAPAATTGGAWACNGIVTGLSGSITFSVTFKNSTDTGAVTGYGNLTVLEL